jgi:nicotinate-nucleotide adenylyltransferase
MSLLGIFGGTFDPIHYGHLRTAFELRLALGMNELRFVPAGDPPHRSAPLADASVRFRMVEAAIADQPGFVADDRELHRAGPSYTLTTLLEFRQEFPREPICLVVGMDAFLGLPEWHRWREILPLAHLVVAHRPGWSAPTEGILGRLLQEHRARAPVELKQSSGGRIYVHPVTQLEISSTELRELVAAGRDPRYLVPDVVRDTIRNTGCYTGPKAR